MNEFRNPHRLSNLLGNIFKEKKWQHRLELHAVFDLWDNVVGNEIASKARPHIIRGHVLIVQVVDSVWMQQLHLQKMHILKKINERLTGEKLEDIRFQLDTRTPIKRTKKTAVNPTGPVDLTRANEFDKMITALDDEGLQKTLKRLWSKFEGLRYSKKE